MDILFVILTIIFIILFSVLLASLILHSNTKIEFCRHCGEFIATHEDHWCQKRVQAIRDKQHGRRWDGISRKITAVYQCPTCFKKRYRVVVFDYKSSLPDTEIMIRSLCGTCKPRMVW
ncbi:MAG: hypothetical protein A2Y62_11620 [Candidatus Fischerbacteria bacterium RBG_13_37_8]|uniref:Uncharacterized protein n=1 Tax=Candidatus Fischerbacteria bacterium RBG_13_37_8 TaxID=1817863 RepID=A0A1F5VI00_9BACT|nr:MAG: hypothetical protein A2Y62_11620 [Candidatus Fischerbacteria bacterium RBG_13_37_8]